jgi:ABC-type multidrug transport system fused ATPase/permease subunit
MGMLTGGLASEAYDRSYTDRQLIRRISIYFAPHWRRVLIVVTMVLLISLITTLVPVLISRGIDALDTNPATALLISLAALVAVLGACSWAFNFVRLRLAARAVGDVVLALREDAFRAVLRHDRAFFDQYSSGRIVSRITSDTQDFATVVTLTVELLSQLVLVLVITLVLFFIEWRMALLVLAIGPVVILVALGFRQLARWTMRQSQRATADVNAIIQETLSGIAVAKNFRQEGTIFSDFRTTNDLAYRVQLRRGMVFGSIFPLLNTLSGAGTALVVYVGGLLVLEGSVTVGNWYLFVQSLTIFFYPLTSVASFWGQFQQGLAASERVFALIDAEPKLQQYASEPVGGLRGEIMFDGVTFAYGGEAGNQRAESGEHRAQREETSASAPQTAHQAERFSATASARAESGEHRAQREETSASAPQTAHQAERFSATASARAESTEHRAQREETSASAPQTAHQAERFSATASATTSASAGGAAAVLRDFTLHIPAGQSLAIVGHTGAGKSSLVKLITRAYEFQGGQILIDGRDIRSLDLGSYRRALGLVPQQPFLFAGTVADNIRYGRPEASAAEVEAAARALGDGSWVDDLPQGLQSEVGERGARLSLGQRQLVALARVTFHNPAILLLDEATASIDPITEAQVQIGLLSVLRGRTSIVIAHRLSTVRAADRIIVLRAGQIIESGQHDELLAQGGHYAELYATYFRHQVVA